MCWSFNHDLYWYISLDIVEVDSVCFSTTLLVEKINDKRKQRTFGLEPLISLDCDLS